MQKLKNMPVIVVLTKCDLVEEALPTDDIWFLLGLQSLRQAGVRLEVAKVTSTTLRGYDSLIKALNTCA